MRILLDLDGVVADFWGPVLREHNARSGERLAISDITDWAFPLEHIWKEPGFFDALPPLPGALVGIERILEQGHEIAIVSAGKGEALAGKSRWLERHLPGLADKAVFTNRKTPKSFVSGDFLVDDGPHNVVAFKALRFGRAVLCRYPYATPEALRAADLVVPFSEHPGKGWSSLVEYFRQWRTR